MGTKNIGSSWFKSAGVNHPILPTTKPSCFAWQGTGSAWASSENGMTRADDRPTCATQAVLPNTSGSDVWSSEVGTSDERKFFQCQPCFLSYWIFILDHFGTGKQSSYSQSSGSWGIVNFLPLTISEESIFGAPHARTWTDKAFVIDPASFTICPTFEPNIIQHRH